MGKAVPRGIKSKANQLLKEFPDKLSTDFEKNKLFINALELPISKSARNLIAGFIARQLKNKAKAN